MFNSSIFGIFRKSIVAGSATQSVCSTLLAPPLLCCPTSFARKQSDEVDVRDACQHTTIDVRSVQQGAMRPRHVECVQAREQQQCFQHSHISHPLTTSARSYSRARRRSQIRNATLGAARWLCTARRGARPPPLSGTAHWRAAWLRAACSAPATVFTSLWVLVRHTQRRARRSTATCRGVVRIASHAVCPSMTRAVR